MTSSPSLITAPSLPPTGAASVSRSAAGPSGACPGRPGVTKTGEFSNVISGENYAATDSHLLEVIETLEAKGAHFRSLRDPIDTSTPQGMFSLQVLGAVAQLERALISERTKAGVAAAKARGRRPGNPGLRDGNPAAIKKIAAARDKAFTDEVLAGMDAWLPTVRQMRPLSPWDDVVRVLNQKPGQDWTPERLRRAVKRAVREKVADPVLLQTAPRSLPDDRLMMLVAGISIANPDLTIRAIASQLEQMRERTPRGSTKWSPSSAQHLLDQARKLGFTPADTDGSPVRP
ncbi:MAG: recombinase family protein [Rhodoblastus sp.]|nr:recombinase family protein [Rhodoblastus sp.]